jgi:SulP family sulfate permease
VGAVALPLALAFGVVSGATAAAGLVTAILAGITIGALSGAPYQISGPTGAMSAILIVITARYGLEGTWLTGIIVPSILAPVAAWDIPTVGAIPRTTLLEVRLRFADIPWEDLDSLIAPALSIAALGAVESLLCGAVASKMTRIRLHANQELIAQGIGNLVNPYFGGVPAAAAIARTSVGIKSRGQTRLVSILHALILLASALLLAPVIARIPLTALAGILMVTAARMNE